MKPTPAIIGFLGFLCLSLTSYGQCEPFFGKLVINEVMPANDATATDNFGEYDDWVEVYNGSDEDINLEGYFLSDNENNETKFQFPNIVIPADGTVIVWCDNQPEQGDMHAEFSLSAGGEEVGLYNLDTLSLDYVRYGQMPDDISIGRFPNGAGPFNKLIPTFDAHNTNTIEPGLVINEYQADNESTAQDQWGEFADWVELYNNSSQPIDMEGYFLSDKIGDPTQFVFPDTTLLPNEYLIIWCDQGLQEPGLHTFFKLGNDGDDILLSDADTLTIDYVRYDIQIPDDSEGRFSNGTGPIACMIPTHGESNGLVDGIFEAKEIEPLKVWPNPAKNSVWIQNESLEIAYLQVFDIHGKLLIETQLNMGQQELDVKGLAPGMYILISGTKQAKIMIE